MMDNCCNFSMDPNKTNMIYNKSGKWVIYCSYICNGIVNHCDLPVALIGSDFIVTKYILHTILTLLQNDEPYFLIRNDFDSSLKCEYLKASNPLYSSANALYNRSKLASLMYGFTGKDCLIVVKSMSHFVYYSCIDISASDVPDIHRYINGNNRDKIISCDDLNDALDSPKADSLVKGLAILISTYNRAGYIPDIIVLEFRNEILKGVVIAG